MSDAADFRPPRALRNPHVQSVLASSGLRRWLRRSARRTLEHTSVEHILDCGHGVRLQGFYTRQSARRAPRALVVLLHGWEGSAQSTYMGHTAARLLAEGCDVFRLNFRDHGDTHHLNREIFHSCRIDEVVGAVAEVGRRFSERPLVIGGFSLGGNFALRVALRARSAGIALAWTFAVCPAISPQATLGAIEASPWFYEQYFLRKWRGSLKRKQALFPEMELFTRAEMNGNLRALTRDLVRRHTDFGSLENYLNGYSIEGDTLQALQIPTTILTAADDPVIPIADFRALALGAETELVIAEHGGHCGFIKDWRLTSWAEDFIVERLRRVG
jgi:predicted alpha/beta-fold hydrolase